MRKQNIKKRMKEGRKKENTEGGGGEIKRNKENKFFTIPENVCGGREKENQTIEDIVNELKKECFPK